MNPGFICSSIGFMASGKRNWGTKRGDVWERGRVGRRVYSRWFRFFTPENVPGVGEVGEWKDKLNNKHPGWKEVLKRAEKAPGSKAKNLY